MATKPHELTLTEKVLVGMTIGMMIGLVSVLGQHILTDHIRKRKRLK